MKLGFERISDVTDQYVARTKRDAEQQYVSIRSALSNTLCRQEWLVQQENCITGARSLNEQDLHVCVCVCVCGWRGVTDSKTKKRCNSGGGAWRPAQKYQNVD